MRQTVTTSPIKLVRSLFRLEFRAAQAKTTRSEIHHLEKKAEAVLLRSSLEKLAKCADANSRLLAVCDNTAFLRRLQHLAQPFQTQRTTQIAYRLNRNVMPCMLPMNSLVGALTSQAILRALTLTSPEKIHLGNPFKAPEQISLALSRGVRSMVAASLEEAVAILECSQKHDRGMPRLIWQFDSADLKEAQNVLLQIRTLEIPLEGLKFIGQAIGQPKFIMDVVAAARDSGHSVSAVYLEASSTQQNQLRPTLQALSQENVQVELTNVDCRNDILCAARVIANRDDRLHFTDVAEEYMSKQIRFHVNRAFKGAKRGDWIAFHPSRVIGLEVQADEIVEVPHDSAGLDSGSFEKLQA